MILTSPDDKTRPLDYYGDSEVDNSHHSPDNYTYTHKQNISGPSNAPTRPPFFQEPSSNDPITPLSASDGYDYRALHSKHEYDSQASLVHNAADIGRSSHYQDLEYAEPTPTDQSMDKKSPLANFLAQGRYPIEQRIENKKRGIGRQKYPFVVWTLTVAMTCVFIYELVVNAREQGTPVSMKPVVNPMLGPSSDVLINVGARFPPCMKNVSEVPITTRFGCLNDTANPPLHTCPLEDICGFGGNVDNIFFVLYSDDLVGFHDGPPAQWFRFILAIFLHAGFIHILLNMLAQLTLSAQERPRW
ncbi:hypothetical protein C0993_008822 [Termitomyces sp. T159_Od127]|nr:hypothetical protein C0993_008822 [Termitomyces sp. T159_Od127]